MTGSTTAIRFSEFGGPEVLRLEEIPLPPPGKGEIQIRQQAIGVNFIDIYHRKGVFAAPLPLPAIPGLEGVGEVIAIGPEVSGFTPGQRVAYLGGPPGGYAVARNIPAARALLVPVGLDSTLVAASLFKGLTAEYLTHRCVGLQPGDTVLWHAAAGGVGSFACQWLQTLGVRVIGVVGSAAKAEIARAQGCTEVIVTPADIPGEVRRITGGEGVAAVFDSVGADTFSASLDCLRPRGTLVSFGESSGPVPPVSLALLGAKGSLYLTRPSIAHYTADRAEYETAAARLFGALQEGVIRVAPPATWALAEVAQAHAGLEGRKTAGSLVLIP